MNTHAETQIAPAPPATTATDLRALRERQKAAWSAGDYALIGVTTQIVGETLCESVNVRGGERVLDVACGNGNAALAAARRWCDVSAVDYVPALLERGRERAEAERLPVDFFEGDAEQLPFEPGRFDSVLSVFGVMFAADHPRAASELLRVCRPGGRIALANWTPGGFIGQLFRLVGSYVPPPAGSPSPMLWGTREYIEVLFGDAAAFIRTTRREFVFRYRSPRHWVELFRNGYGPILKTFDALDPSRRRELERDLLALLRVHDRAGDGSLLVPGEYLEVVLEKR
jgi:ubiquinone/menaquinone biosynthesis C-methylase UbiE